MTLSKHFMKTAAAIALVAGMGVGCAQREPQKIRIYSDEFSTVAYEGVIPPDGGIEHNDNGHYFKDACRGGAEVRIEDYGTHVDLPPNDYSCPKP